MKRQYLIIFSFFLFLIQPFFGHLIYASSFDFQLIPKTTKSESSEGYFSKIPLSPLTVQKGKLDFFKQNGWDFISFEGDYDEKTGELKGVFTGASTSKNFPNSGASYYCEFTAQIEKDQKTTTLKYYPTHGTAETLNHCYAQVVFDFEKNQRASKDDWWPDDLVFDIQPLNQEEKLEDSGVRFSDIAGEVEILLPTGYDDNGEPIFEDEEGWNHAKLDMPLPYGAKVRLGDKSRIILSMPDMSTYEMRTPDNSDGPAVEIILPRKNKNENVLKLLAGNLWINLKKMVKDGSMDIEMGQAVAGIKGTTIILEENGKTSSLKVIEGEVEFRSKNTNKSEIVKAGEMIIADKNGLGAKSFFEVKDESNKWGYNQSTLPKESSLSFLMNRVVYLWLSIVLILIIGVLVLLFSSTVIPLNLLNADSK